MLCIGPGWDAGGWSTLAHWAAGFVAPGGHVVLGEAAWRRRPTTGELRTLGMDAEAYPISERVEGFVARSGVQVLWSGRARSDDWEAYGERYRTAMLDFVRSAPDDPLAAAARERSGTDWPTFELLHSILDFVLIFGRPGRPTAGQ